jgi:hypothetical protein
MICDLVLLIACATKTTPACAPASGTNTSRRRQDVRFVWNSSTHTNPLKQSLRQQHRHCNAYLPALTCHCLTTLIKQGRRAASQLAGGKLRRLTTTLTNDTHNTSSTLHKRPQLVDFAKMEMASLLRYKKFFVSCAAASLFVERTTRVTTFHTSFRRTPPTTLLCPEVLAFLCTHICHSNVSLSRVRTRAHVWCRFYSSLLQANDVNKSLYSLNSARRVCRDGSSIR